jgi:hypothetical protein
MRISTEALIAARERAKEWKVEWKTAFTSPTGLL